MSIDEIIEGLEAELSLMRELGVRLVPFDRELLKEIPTPQSTPLKPKPARIAALDSIKKTYDFVFIHDRPLSEKGTEMLDKIIEAMGKTRETAPLLTEYDPKTFPKAKVYIVMGTAALKKFMPDMRIKYFSNAESAGGRKVHFTYSPDYITRFDQKDPSIISIKIQMWRALKQFKNI